MCKIKDFEKGTNVIGFFAVKDMSEKETKGKKKYLDFILQDVSGEINAKAWEVEQNIIGTIPQKGTIVKADAIVDEYKGALQLKINKIRLVSEEDEYDQQAIVPTAPYSSESMYILLNKFIDKISDERLKTFIQTLVQKHKEKLMYYPAAKSNHHSIQGGLLYHITTMLKAAEKLTSVYSFNTDILYTGIILHDIGKLYELYVDGSATDYTIEGELLGHIAIGLRIIDESANDLDIEKKLILQHMVISHHQNPEWGSPKRPMTKEAELLHHLDMIDAKMYDFEKAQNQTNAGMLSDKVFSLGNRRVYHGLS